MSAAPDVPLAPIRAPYQADGPSQPLPLASLRSVQVLGGGVAPACTLAGQGRPARGLDTALSRLGMLRDRGKGSS